MNDVYGGTNRYFKRVASQNGVESTFVDMSTLEPLKAAWRPNTKLVWIETPTNPTLRLVDIQAVASWVHQQHPGTIVVVDNTFMSPYFQVDSVLCCIFFTKSVFILFQLHVSVRWIWVPMWLCIPLPNT